jgi:putative Mn2+ efflux pump MntP
VSSRDSIRSVVLSLLIVAFSVAADATAVAIAASVRGTTFRRGMLLATAFGLAQAVMAGLGWYGGAALGALWTSWDHWVALALLTFVGGKMIKEALEPEEEREANVTNARAIFVLSIATSLDALAVGVSLPALGNSALISLFLIGAITFLCSAAGAAFGRVLGQRFGRGMEIAGGIALIAIGIRIAFGHGG